jgi:hypothetical protein
MMALLWMQSGKILKKAVIETAEQMVGEKKYERNQEDWFDEECKKSSKERISGY